MTLHYLKPTIKAEPLVWRWYAWSYLVSPVTAAANIVERHLKIMQSYAQNPQTQAVKDPKMLRGILLTMKQTKLKQLKSGYSPQSSIYSFINQFTVKNPLIFV